MLCKNENTAHDTAWLAPGPAPPPSLHPPPAARPADGAVPAPGRAPPGWMPALNPPSLHGKGSDLRRQLARDLERQVLLGGQLDLSQAAGARGRRRLGGRGQAV